MEREVWRQMAAVGGGGGDGDGGGYSVYTWGSLLGKVRSRVAYSFGGMTITG